MAQRSEQISPAMNSYLSAHSTPPDPLLRELSARTARLFPGETELSVPPEEGTLLALLSRITHPRYAVELGTFTGYSSVCIARGLADDGQLLCCDVNAETTAVARDFWAKAGLADRVELRLGPALDTLRALPEEPVFDLAFIDADKISYPRYWAEVVPRTRSGGLICVDNTFSHGRVLDTANDNPAVVAVRRMNDMAAADDRVDLVMVPIGDGLTVAVVR